MVFLFFLFILLFKEDVVLISTAQRWLDDGSFLANRQRCITHVLVLDPQRHPVVDPKFTLCKASLNLTGLNTLCDLMMESPSPVSSVFLHQLKTKHNRWVV